MRSSNKATKPAGRSRKGGRSPRRPRRIQSAIATQTDLRDRLDTVFRKAHKHGAIAITRRGKPVAVMLSMDEFAMLSMAYVIRKLSRDGIHSE